MGAQYMFVVKNAESASFSNSDEHERRLIHRHVQISSIHRRQALPGQTGDNLLPIIQVNPRTKHVRSSRHAFIGSSRVSDALAPRSSVASKLACRCFLSSQTHCPIHAVPRMPAAETRVVDPFASTAVNINRMAHSLLQYFVHISHPRTWYSEVQKDETYTFQRDALTLVRGCFEKEIHFYTLLASMASQMQHFDRVGQDEDRTNLLATKAVAAVRRHLSTFPPVNQRLVFDIHQLAVTEFYRHELESALVHLKAVKALLPHIGGIGGIDPSLREWLVIGDGYVAAELLSKPLYSPLCFDPGDLISKDQVVASQQSLAGACLHLQKYRAILPPQMQSIILDITAAVQVMQQQLEVSASNGKAPGKSTATMHWLLLRTTALRHRLLDLDIDDHRANAIRRVLIMWLFLTMTVTGRQRTCKILSSKLKLTLTTTINSSGWAGYEDALLWILLTGGMSSSTADRHWYSLAIKKLGLGHTRATATRIAFRWENLASFCQQFFYLDNIQEPMLRALISDVNAIRVM